MIAHGENASWSDVPEDVPRVLLECPAGSSPLLIADAIERQGYAVKVCEGPDARTPCSLVSEGVCALVSGADVVVNLLNGPDPEARRVITAIAEQRRPPEVVTELTQPEIERHADDEDWPFRRDHVTIVASPLTSRTLLLAIEEALSRRVGSPAWIDGFLD